MSEKQVNKISVANPTALGLFGLGIVTLVAASQKLGITTGLSYVIVYAVFLGATAQLIASIFDFFYENIWGATVLGAYAFFWYAIATCWLIAMGAFGPALKAAIDVKQIGFAFLGYLIFSVLMTIGAVEINKVILIDMIFIDILLLALTLQAFGVNPKLMGFIGGVTEFIVSMISFYGSAAVVLNTHFGRPFLPVGKPMGIFKK